MPNTDFGDTTLPSSTPHFVRQLGYYDDLSILPLVRQEGCYRALNASSITMSVSTSGQCTAARQVLSTAMALNESSTTLSVSTSGQDTAAMQVLSTAIDHLGYNKKPAIYLK